MTNKVELTKVCVDYLTNPAQVAQFSKGSDVEAKIREAFIELLGTDQPTEKHMRKHGVEVFEILEKVIEETYLKGINEDEFFMQFAEFEQVGRGDTVTFFVEDDAILTISEHAGNHWDISRQKLEGGTSFPVKTKAYALAVYGDFERFLTGRSSFATLVSKIADSVKRKMYAQVAASFASASAALPTEFKATGTYDEDKLIALYSHVEAASGSAVIVGTRNAINQIATSASINWISEKMKDDMNARGVLGEYKGMTLVQLPAVHKENTFDFAYDDNQLLVLPLNNDKFIKVVKEGEDYIKEVSDNGANQDMSYEYKYTTRFGIATVFSSLYGVYTLA